MPRAPFFAQLGQFVQPRFLDPAECESLREEMRAAPTMPASIVDEHHQVAVLEERRRCDDAMVSPETRERMTARVLAVKPALEAHFGVSLSGCQPLSFLVYREGCYFGRHFDNNRDTSTLSMIRDRIVSVSIFLNGPGEAHEADTYAGGAFLLHGLRMGGPTAKEFAFPLDGEEGLLFAFPSDLSHEVLPITRGTRYSIVAWFI